MTTAIIKRTLVGAAMIACLGITAVAQDPAPAPPQQTAPDAGNDPFRRVVPKATKVPEQKDADKPVLVPFPTVEQRRAEFQQTRQRLVGSGQAEPDPIGQYLVSELIVTGVFQTDEGIGAFILAVPTNNTFFVKAGTRVYNGRIESINTGSDFSVGQVVFSELTKYRIRKKEDNRVNMITKAVTSPTTKAR